MSGDGLSISLFYKFIGKDGTDQGETFFSFLVSQGGSTDFDHNTLRTYTQIYYNTGRPKKIIEKMLINYFIASLQSKNLSLVKNTDGTFTLLNTDTKPSNLFVTSINRYEYHTKEALISLIYYELFGEGETILGDRSDLEMPAQVDLMTVVQDYLIQLNNTKGDGRESIKKFIKVMKEFTKYVEKNNIIFTSQFTDNLNSIQQFVEFLYPSYDQTANIDAVPFGEQAGSKFEEFKDTLNEIAPSGSISRKDLFLEIDKDPGMANDFMRKIAEIDGRRKVKKERLRSVVADVANLAFLLPDVPSRDYAITQLADGALHENHSMMGIKKVFTVEEKARLAKENAEKLAEQEHQQQLIEARRKIELATIQKTATEAEKAFENIAKPSEAQVKADIIEKAKKELTDALLTISLITNDENMKTEMKGKLQSLITKYNYTIDEKDREELKDLISKANNIINQQGGYPFQSIQKVIDAAIDEKLKQRGISSIPQITPRPSMTTVGVDSVEEEEGKGVDKSSIEGTYRKETISGVLPPADKTLPGISQGEEEKSATTEEQREADRTEAERLKAGPSGEEEPVAEEGAVGIPQGADGAKASTSATPLSNVTSANGSSIADGSSQAPPAGSADESLTANGSALAQGAEANGSSQTPLPVPVPVPSSELATQAITSAPPGTEEEEEEKFTVASPNLLDDCLNNPEYQKKEAEDLRKSCRDTTYKNWLIAYIKNEELPGKYETTVEEFFSEPKHGNRDVIDKYSQLLNNLTWEENDDLNHMKFEIILDYIRHKYWHEVPRILANIRKTEKGIDPESKSKNKSQNTIYYVPDENIDNKYNYLMKTYMNKQKIKFNIPSELLPIITDINSEEFKNNPWKRLIDKYRESNSLNRSKLNDNKAFFLIITNELNGGYISLADGLQYLIGITHGGGAGDDDDAEDQEAEMDEDTKRLQRYKKSIEGLETVKTQIVEVEDTILNFKPVLNKYTTESPLIELEQVNKDYQETEMNKSEYKLEKEKLELRYKSRRGEDFNKYYEKYKNIRNQNETLNKILSMASFDEIKTQIRLSTNTGSDTKYYIEQQLKKDLENEISAIKDDDKAGKIETIKNIINNYLATNSDSNQLQASIDNTIQNLENLGDLYGINNDNRATFRETLEDKFKQSYAGNPSSSQLKNEIFDELIKEIPRYKYIIDTERSYASEIATKKNRIATVETNLGYNIDPGELQIQIQLLAQSKTKVKKILEYLKDIISIIHVAKFKTEWVKDFKKLREGSTSIENLIQKLIERTVKSMDAIKMRFQNLRGIDNQLRDRFDNRRFDERMFNDRKDEDRQYEERKTNEYAGGQTNVDINDPQVIFNLLTEKITKLKELTEQLISFSQRNSNTFALISTNGEPSMFVQLYNKYIEDRADPNISKLEASEGLTEGVASSMLAPKDILHIDMYDKTVFVGLILFLRVFAVSFVNFLIDRKKLKTIESTLAVYLIIYTVFFSLFVLLINIDTYRMRIIFNYINVHGGYGPVILHILIIWIFGALLFIVLRNIRVINNPTNSKITEARTSEERAKLRNRIGLISMLIWIITTIVVIIS